MKTISIWDKSLLEGKQILLDDEDYERVKKSIYWLNISSAKSKIIEVEINKKTISLANFILGLDNGILVDHKDRNPFNNQKSNFRICDHQQNLCNRGPNNQRKYKGVSFDKRVNRYQARICKLYKQIHLGNYNTEIEAAKAYDKAAKKYHGEFAYLNFPTELENLGK